MRSSLPSSEPPHSLTPAAARLVDRLERAIPEMAIRGTEIILTEIPAYGGQTDDGFAEDLRANAQRTFELMVLSLRGAALTDDDFDFARASMSRRARRGLSLGDYVHTYRIGLRVAWEEIESAVDDNRSRDAALSLIGPALHFTDVSSTFVAAAFEEVDRILAASGERVRRDVLEDLLAGRVPRPGARDEALRAAGLGPEHSHVVVSARPEVAGRADDHVLFAAARSLGRVVSEPMTPLSVFREDEVVAILPINPERVSKLAAALRIAQAKLRRQGAPLIIGASTVIDGLAALPAAYWEAGFAQSLATTENPVSCLFELSAPEYLTMTADETAARLIRREVTEFVAEDLNGGGVLIDTLLAYADAGFNVKAASERLYVHVNTAHARLDRIAERTGCDLRTLDGVNELRVAVELARAQR
jgi:hypothetical protein